MVRNDHPGVFGYTSGGIVAIHADWPAYPAEHGWEVAIATLGMFPEGTPFRRIDDIDQCALFLAEGYGKYSDPYDSRAFHAAAWHEDLLEAQELGLVEGLEAITYREYEERRRNDMRAAIMSQFELKELRAPLDDVLDHLGYEVDGRFVPILLDVPDDMLDEPLDRGWLGTDPLTKVRLTTAGRKRLDQLWADAFDVPQALRGRVDVMVNARLYDSALRDIGVMIESRMRDISNSCTFGAKLVEDFIQHLDSSERFYNPALKVLRADIRTAFKFIRNEFAHNLVQLPRPRAYALLGRTCNIVREVDASGKVLESSTRTES